MTTTTARAEGRPGGRSPLGWLTQQGLRGMARREALTGYLFILPTYFGFLLFVLGPVGASGGRSFYDWDRLAHPAPRSVRFQSSARLPEPPGQLTAFSTNLRSA